MTDQTTTPPTAHRHGALTALVLLLLLAVAAGFALGWKQLAQRDAQIAALRQQIARGEQTHDKLRLELQAQNEQLVQTQTRLASLIGSDRDGWRLSEAEVLLRLSNDYALLAQDSKTADHLLMNADDVLQEVEINATDRALVSGVRRKIADEHAALARAANSDREGIYFRLEALVNLIDQLPVVDVHNLSKQDPEPTETTLPAGAPLGDRLFASLRRALAKIGGYIRIQQHAYDKPPLLAPEQQPSLREEVRLRLEVAQLALLQHRQTLYETSLKDARTAITQYYVLPADTRAHLLEEIDTCLASPANAALPDLGDALRALVEYRQSLARPQEH